MDHTYLSGMLEALPRHIAGDVDMVLHEQLRYPTQLRYGKEREMLPALAIKLKVQKCITLRESTKTVGTLIESCD